VSADNAAEVVLVQIVTVGMVAGIGVTLVGTLEGSVDAARAI
jgi:hypothetical protein